MPGVSVIIPVYNAESFLEETIQTVLKQTYEDWEIILVDDGSTDNSKNIALQYVSKDKRIHYIYKENGGQASARNEGVRQSKGGWIAMLDADDLWHPEKLKKQIEAVEKDSRISLCYTNTSAFKDHLSNELENQDQGSYGLSQNTILFPRIYHHNHISNSSIIIKKALFDEIGWYDERPEIRGSEDLDFLLRALSTPRFSFGLEEKLFFYRLHEGGVHNQSVRMFIGKTLAYEKQDENPLLRRLAKVKKYRYVYRELLNALWTNNQKEEIKIYFKKFTRKDPYGIGTLKQRALIKIVPLSIFMSISKNIIYRIFYRLEKLTYWMIGL